ncbi:MAG: hypothetical protein IH600_16470 [Bacteroidetes bacterium]|nr:hypothetical protein [Bacteroidota bacterium]
MNIKHGPYSGRYPIFRTIDRFRKEWPESRVIIPWFKGEKGDWILTDDAYVVQVLNTYMLGNPEKRKRLTKVVRVAWNSFPYYQRLDGTTSSRMTFSPKRANAPASMAKHTTPRHGKSWTSKKKHFAWLVVAKELAPYQAYMKAFQTSSISRARRLSSELMKEDRLMKEVADIYKKLFDSAGMTDEDIATQIADIAKNNKSGKTRLDAIRLALELRGEASNGVNVNMRFPQLPAASASVTTAGKLMAPPRQALPDRILPEHDADEPADMEEAIVVDDMEEFRLPNGEIRVTGNTNFLEHRQRRSMEKLRWEREEGLTEQRRRDNVPDTIIEKSPNPASSEQTPDE